MQMTGMILGPELGVDILTRIVFHLLRQLLLLENRLQILATAIATLTRRNLSSEEDGRVTTTTIDLHPSKSASKNLNHVRKSTTMTTMNLSTPRSQADVTGPILEMQIWWMAMMDHGASKGRGENQIGTM